MLTGGGYFTETSLNLKEKCAAYGFAGGSKSLSVYAIDANDRRITEIWKGTYSYTPEHGTLAAPQNLSWDGFTLSWNSDEHAEYHVLTLYRKDSAEGTALKERTYLNVTGSSINFKTEAASELLPGFKDPVPGAYYMAEIYSKSTQGYGESARVSSGYSKLAEGTVSEILNIALSGNVLSWDAYTGASIYEIYFGNAGIRSNTNSVDLKENMDNLGMADGTYQLRIAAYDASVQSGGQRLSLLTDAPSYEYTGNGPLATPQNLVWDGFTARWDEVEHADSYSVSVRRKSDDTVFLSTSLTSNYLTVGSEPIPGESYLFTVQAKSTHGYSSSTEASSSWIYFPMKYDISIDESEHGRVRACVDKVTVEKAEEGQNIELVITPASGYYLHELRVNDAVLSGESFVMPAEAVSITAEFREYVAIASLEATVTVPAAGALPGKTVTVPEGAHYSAAITSIREYDSESEYTEPFVGGKTYYYSMVFTPEKGYGFSEAGAWSLNGENKGNYGGGDAFLRTVQFSFTASYPAISGSIEVSGSSKYEESLTASFGGSETASFKWYAGENLISSSASCTLSYDTYIGSELKVVVSEENYSGTLEKSLGIIAKKDGPAAPSLTYTKPTSTGASDGAINGTSASMEWTSDLSDVPAACTGSSITGLAAGTYYVREAESSTALAGEWAVISIPDGNGIVTAAYAYTAQPVYGETTADTVTAGDSTYTVSIVNTTVYYDEYKYYNLKFDAAEGFSFNDGTKLYLNGVELTIQGGKTGEGSYSWLSGYVQLPREKLPLSGSVSLSGSGEYATSLSVDLSKLTNKLSDDYSLNYKWLVDGAEIEHNDNTFFVEESRIGHEISVRVSDPKRSGYIESAPVLTVKKANSEAAPVVEVYEKPSEPGAADGEFFYNYFYYGGYEYSADGLNWTEIPQGSSYAEGFAAGSYYFRKKESSTEYAGTAALATMPEGDVLISLVSISIAEPVEGSLPVTAAAVTAGANYSVTVQSCIKTSDNSPVSGAFEAQVLYQYELRILANPGYKLLQGSTTVKVNGKAVGIVGGSTDASESYILVRPAYTCAYVPLTGTLEIAGDAIAGGSVSAVLTGANISGSENLTYRWYINGELKAYGSDVTEYSISEEEAAGSELSLSLTDNRRSGSLNVGPVVILKNGLSKRATPEASFSAETMRLSNVESGMKYRVGSGAWVDITSADPVDLSEAVVSACTLYVKRAGDGIEYFDSDSQNIIITKAETPALTASQPLYTGDKGSIAAVTDAMEYKKGESGSWTACAEGTLGELEPDTYYIRVKASGTTLASEAQSLTINAFAGVFTASRSGKSISLTLSGLPTAGIAIVAEYDGGKMTGVWRDDIEAGASVNPAFTVKSESSSVKCFVMVAAGNKPAFGSVTL